MEGHVNIISVSSNFDIYIKFFFISSRRTFRGHSKDIIGVCWSPDDSLVASCSIDNSVFIWNVQENRSVKKIEEGQGFIKGVAWDPIGKYIATHSVNAVRLWKVENWSLASEIKVPFEKSLDEAMSYGLE